MSVDHALTVRVGLEGSQAYDILIAPGLIAEAGKHIAQLSSTSAKNMRVMIMSDDNVFEIYGKDLTQSLQAEGFTVSQHIIPAGEKSKSFAEFQHSCEAVINAKLERGDILIALGGGVVGDLTGFVAASVRRGIGFVQIPTSLLAQVDSSVGGKTGINAKQGKNLVGAFYQPKLVLADTATLDTLSPREFRAGYGEIAKYGLINDAEFFAWLENNHTALFASGGVERAHAIAVSCRSKAGIVARDEREHGERALLNLGHTFGHAIEGAAQYDGEVIVHGEAVAIGMAMAHRFSARMNLASPDDARRLETHLKAVGLPTTIAAHCNERAAAKRAFDGLTAQKMLDYIAQDKKVSRSALTFILTRGIGQSFIANDVPASEVLSFLSEELLS